MLVSAAVNFLTTIILKNSSFIKSSLFLNNNSYLGNSIYLWDFGGIGYLLILRNSTFSRNSLEFQSTSTISIQPMQLFSRNILFLRNRLLLGTKISLFLNPQICLFLELIFKPTVGKFGIITHSIGPNNDKSCNKTFLAAEQDVEVSQMWTSFAHILHSSCGNSLSLGWSTLLCKIIVVYGTL